MQSYGPFDELESILLFYPAPQAGPPQFSSDREKIHTAFYALKKKYPQYFEGITFRENVLFPRSKVLDEILSTLQPDYLGKINPTYDTYQIKIENLKKLWDEKLKSHFGSKEDELRKMAREFKEIMDAV